MTSRSPDFRSPLARLSRVALFKPRDREGKMKYEVNLLFPKDADLSEIKTAVIEAAKAEWGDKAVELLKKKVIKQPILDGDGEQGVSKKTGEQYKELEGMWFIRCSSNLQPALFSKQVTAAQEGKDLYSGCFGYAVIHAYTWENDKNGKGVSIGLSMVQMARDGEKLGGTPADPSKFFDKIDTSDAGGSDDQSGGDGGGDEDDDGAAALFS
jgi:hypothetical protein